MEGNLIGLIGAFCTGVAGPLIVAYVKHRLELQKKPCDMVREAIEVSNLITTKIEHLKEEFNADRVWIAQFHNGGHFYPTGKSIAKFSIFYETVKNGTSSIQSNFQNIPVNIFSKSINHLLENDCIEIPDLKDEKIATHGLKYVCEEAGDKSVYMFAIKTIDEKFIGTLGIAYTKKKTKLDEDSVNHIIKQASSMGGVLMNHLQQK